MGDTSSVDLAVAAQVHDRVGLSQRRRPSVFIAFGSLIIVSVALVALSGLGSSLGFGAWQLLFASSINLTAYALIFFTKPGSPSERLAAHVETVATSASLGWLSSLSADNYMVGFFVVTALAYMRSRALHARAFSIVTHWLCYVGFAALRNDQEYTLYVALLATAAAFSHYLYARYLHTGLVAEARRFRQQRTEIAQKLHDGLGAELTGLLLQARQDPEVAPRVEAALEELRRIIAGLQQRPRSLQAFALLLRARIERLLPKDCSLEVGCSGDAHLPSELCEALEYTALEGVRNALAHGGATSVVVDLEVNVNVTLTVRDNGCGMGDATPKGGLVHIAERARLFGGSSRMAQSTLYWSAPILRGGLRVSPSMSE